MALWPNSRRDIMGWSPTSIDGNFWYKQHLLPWQQRQKAVFTTLSETSSHPEGMAPHGAILHPLVAGGVTGAATLDLDASGTMLSGSMLTGSGSGEFTASGDMSLITSMTGAWDGDFTTNSPTLNMTLALSGAWTSDLDGSATLAIIDPMTGSFDATLDGSADLKGRLRMDGEWSTSDTPLTVAYEGAIYIAPWGTDGVTYPSGTATSPVFSLDSAIYLCNKYSLKTIYLRGSYVLDDDEEGLIDNFEFKGWGPLQFCKLNLGGLLLDTVHFHDLVLEGTLNTTAIGGTGWQSSIARVQFDGCYLQSITNLQGVARGCQIDGATSIAPGGWFSSSDTVIEGDFTVFDMQNTAGTTLSVDIASGWAQVDNMVTGCLSEFNFKGGELTFLGGCTGGEYYIEGVGTLFDESNGGAGGALTKKENHLIWDEDATYVNRPGTMGRLLNSAGSGGVDPQTLRNAMTYAATRASDAGSIDYKIDNINPSIDPADIWNYQIPANQQSGTTGEMLTHAGPSVGVVSPGALTNKDFSDAMKKVKESIDSVAEMVSEAKEAPAEDDSSVAEAIESLSEEIKAIKSAPAVPVPTEITEIRESISKIKDKLDEPEDLAAVEGLVKDALNEIEEEEFLVALKTAEEELEFEEVLRMAVSGEDVVDKARRKGNIRKKK